MAYLKKITKMVNSSVRFTIRKYKITFGCVFKNPQNVGGVSLVPVNVVLSVSESSILIFAYF